MAAQSRARLRSARLWEVSGAPNPLPGRPGRRLPGARVTLNPNTLLLLNFVGTVPEQVKNFLYRGIVDDQNNGRA